MGLRKRLLTRHEIENLTLLMRKTFTYIIELRSINALAEWIQYPKVPSILSESLVVHLVNGARLIATSPGDHARLGAG
jgi:hypothetical protein